MLAAAPIYEDLLAEIKALKVDIAELQRSCRPRPMPSADRVIGALAFAITGVAFAFQWGALAYDARSDFGYRVTIDSAEALMVVVPVLAMEFLASPALSLAWIKFRDNGGLAAKRPRGGRTSRR